MPNQNKNEERNPKKEVINALADFIIRASKENAKPEERAILADVAHAYASLVN